MGVGEVCTFMLQAVDVHAADEREVWTALLKVSGKCWHVKA